MTNTKSISTRVNPDRRLVPFASAYVFNFIIRLLTCLFNVILNRKNRNDHSDKNGSDEASDQKEHQGFHE